MTAACAGLVLAAAASSWIGEAHKGVTSKHTYNEDVNPIFVSRCSHCHVDGGVAPMSLVTYGDAFPWAESLRTELLDAETSETDDYVKTAHRDLSARELDVVLDWAVGGTPEGDPAKTPAALTLTIDWAGGKPDLVLRPSAPFEIPAEAMEVTHEFVLPFSGAAERHISAIDLLPGTPAIVRDATVLMRAPGGAATVLGTWTPRQSPAAIALKPGTVLQPGTELIARIHYKKTWKYEGQPMTDQSTLGVYVADH
jgi:hypothetical protein